MMTTLGSGNRAHVRAAAAFRVLQVATPLEHCRHQIGAQVTPRLPLRTRGDENCHGDARTSPQRTEEYLQSLRLLRAVQRWEWLPTHSFGLPQQNDATSILYEHLPSEPPN